jgi:hypothetical protein
MPVQHDAQRPYEISTEVYRMQANICKSRGHDCDLLAPQAQEPFPRLIEKNP